MFAKYILAVVGAVFLIAAFRRSFIGPQARTCLTVGLIFAVVSIWLFFKT